LIFKILEEMSFMKKIKLIIAAASLMGMVSSSSVYADGFAPGEGLYVGAFAGVGMGMVAPKVTTSALTANDRPGGTFEAKDGGLGLEGIEGGAWMGYGYKMGDLYAGLEGEMAVGNVEFKLTSSVPVYLQDQSGQGDTGVTEVSATKDWTGGLFGRVGYYVNQDTLLTFRGGVLVSKFDVAWGSNTETYYGGGPSLGLDLSSRITAIDPNLSVRMGGVYTDFMTAPVSGIGTLTSKGELNDNEVTGSALSARIGLQYSFFDINSLF
jgi:hypothetical protein